MANKIYFVIRFDDPSPTSKHHVEIKVLQELVRRNIPATFAVIPFRTINNGNKISYRIQHGKHLREGLALGLVEVALHGYTHTNAGLSPDGANSEFAGVSALAQKNLIAEGKAHLETVFGPVIHGFVPPFNSYDQHTLRAVEAEGLQYLSADRRPPPRSNIPILPVTCKLYNLKNAVAEARRFMFLNPAVVLVLHHYDFDHDDDDPPGKVYSYEQFGNMLDWLKKQPDLQMVTLQQLSNKLSHKAPRWARQDYIRNLLPWRFKHLLPQLCFATKRYILPRPVTRSM